MVNVAPFKAIRLSRGKNKDISDFICPPYDVISPRQREQLVRKSKINVVQLELPMGVGEVKYLQASKVLREWKEKEVLQMDRRESFYLLETTFQIDDPFAPKSKWVRYGVLVALRLEIPGKGAVRPHEKTLPKAKEDRLNLLNSVQTNISPIFGLFFDSKKEWRHWIKRATKKSPVAKGVENKKLSHRMWKIEDPKMQLKLRNVLNKKNLFIADGHHRYEVSWAYKETRLKNEPKADLRRGWQYVMTYVCPMEESGLLMLPTHRLIKSDKSLKEWQSHLSSMFDLIPVKNWKDLLKGLKEKTEKKRRIGWISAKGCFLLELKKKFSVARCLPTRSAPLRALDVVLLHDLILEESRGAQYVKDKNIFFTQDIQGMVKKAQEHSSWVGFVLRSAGVESLARVASAGEVMPPKTTYFYPKVPTGFTLMPLDQRI